ncbi:MAG: PAS domain S-box protein [Nevskiaceae bacterium]|nr:MAG: PAS domain S-box protein [Nevskiaceae bacterium]TAM31041.1 MAG: PAS domain S-box protein [Nevskiaceae bacterium]
MVRLAAAVAATLLLPAAGWGADPASLEVPLSTFGRGTTVAFAVLLALAIVWILWLRAEIGKRRRAQLRAELAERRLSELAAAIPGALWQFRREPDGRQYYSYMSEGIRRITGRTPEETNVLMQTQAFSSVHPEDKERLQGFMQRLADKDGLAEERYRLQTSTGDWRWVRSAAVGHRLPGGTLVWNGITLDATRIQDAEQALRTARLQMQELIDSVPGAVWRLRLSADGRYLVDYVSEGVSLVSGRTAVDHLGDVEGTLSTLLAEDRERLLVALESSAREGSLLQIEVRLWAADGSLRHLLVRANVSRNAQGEPVWTGVLQDMTEHRGLEAALVAARSRLDDIVANFPGTIWQLRRDGQGREALTYLSEGVARLVGLPTEALLGQPPSVLDHMLSSEDLERVRRILEQAVDSPHPVSFDYCLRPDAGDPRWVQVTATGRRGADGEVVWNGVVLDATEQKQMELDLKRARAAAESASQAKSRFLANMSHEIRTPMNAVIGLSYLALDAEQEPAKRERLGKINRAAKALLRLLNDILEFSKLEAQKLRLMPVPFSLTDLVDSLQLLAGTSAAEKGLRFGIEIGPGLPRQLQGDALRIQQVLLNLLANATKFTDAGEVNLRIRRAEEPSAPGGLALAFEVSDTGVGMSEAQLARVFDVFEQADDSASRRHGGTGLGLTITHELVRLMGGEIRVRSQPGQGTVFTVVLPLELPEHSDLARTLAPVAEPEEALGDCVSRLQQMLRQHDTAARGKALVLRSMLLTQGRERDLELLERQLAVYDFESAELELRRLARRWGLMA